MRFKSAAAADYDDDYYHISTQRQGSHFELHVVSNIKSIAFNDNFPGNYTLTLFINSKEGEIVKKNPERKG